MFRTSNPENAQGIPILAIHLDDSAVHLLRRVVASVSGFVFGASVQQYFGEKDASLIRTLREIHPEVCLIDLDRDRRMALDTVEYLRRTALSPISIFAVSSQMDSESIIAAMRSGCTEYLEKPLQADRIEEALVQLSRKKRDSLVSSVQGKLITLMGVKGGVGATTLAVHLAYSLAKRGKKVLLIDHHPELGEATLHLSLEHHNYGFYELACNLSRMDAELLQGFALKHESGLEVLASPEGLGMTPKTTPEAVQQTLRFLLRMYDYVVVDTACGFDEQNLAILEASDEFNLIATPQSAIHPQHIAISRLHAAAQLPDVQGAGRSQSLVQTSPAFRGEHRESAAQKDLAYHPEQRAGAHRSHCDGHPGFRQVKVRLHAGHQQVDSPSQRVARDCAR